MTCGIVSSFGVDFPEGEGENLIINTTFYFRVFLRLLMAKIIEIRKKQ